MKLGKAFSWRLGRVASGLLILAAASHGRAYAIPLWAHQYRVTCQKCHSVVPHLTPFGMHFAANGYRIVGVSPGPAFPISVKTNLLYSSAYQGPGQNGAGLPKAIFDEVEFLTGGGVGSRGGYFIEQYAVDGGNTGLLREGWASYRSNPWNARIPVSLQAGSQTLPLPVDPETFRETYQDYAVYTQTVGSNPFNFFDPKIGVKLSAGDPLRGFNVDVFAGPGHDRQSGLQTIGTDSMVYAQQVLGPLTLSAYRYSGERPVPSAPDDWFERTGFGAVTLLGKWECDAVLQTGYDSDPTASARGSASSGGFAQVRYAFDTHFFALARYDGTNSEVAGLAHDGVVLLGFRPDHGSRVTIEDVITHTPQTQNTMNLQYTVAH